jgi:hypothetical protein
MLGARVPGTGAAALHRVLVLGAELHHQERRARLPVAGIVLRENFYSR